MALPGGVNPLDFLYKLANQRGLQPPTFQQLDEQGPPHCKTFVWQCSFFGLESQGMGRSKKEAKLSAAKAIKDQINVDSLPPPAAAEKKRKLNVPANKNPNKKKKNGQDAKKMGFGMGMPPMPFGCFPGPAPDGGPDFMDPNGGFFADISQEESFGPDGGFFCGPPGPFVFLPGPIFCSRLSKMDRIMIKKHKDICPAETDLASLLQLVRDTEQAMKEVAEGMNGEENSEKITGMIRVGDFAKGLLLRTSKQVEVVLMCQAPPTKSLQEKVIKSLQENFSEKLAEKNYEVREFANSPTFHVISNSDEGTLTCVVTMTSVALRKKPKVKSEDGQEGETDEPLKEEPVVDEALLLPKEKSLLALQELRRARWFAAMASTLPSCVECIRVVRNLAKDDAEWGLIPDWGLELLVERALYSARIPLNPAASIMRVMEVVASGLFLNFGPSLKDPCEHENIDVVAHLTTQQRENLTRSGQSYLRMMHFRQLHKVLRMELEEFEQHENGADENEAMAKTE